MVATNLASLKGGMVGTLQFKGSSSTAPLFMCDPIVSLKMQAYNNDSPKIVVMNQDPPPSSNSRGPLDIDEPSL